MTIPDPLTDADLRAIWPDYAPTPLVHAPRLASAAGVARVWLKNEAQRPLGNFKALGGMVAGLKAICRSVGADGISDLLDQPARHGRLPTLICASDGNHGLAVAAAAARTGARALIFLPAGVARIRSDRIEALGATVIWIDGTYDDAVEAAERASLRGEGLLVPDTTAGPASEAVLDVMAGYGVLVREIRDALMTAGGGPPSHQFIQAGVGGLAAAMARGFGRPGAGGPALIVVEPSAAACVAHGLRRGRPERIAGDLATGAGMLSCGLASAPALAILQAHGAQAVAVDEEQLHAAAAMVARSADVETTASGAAGVAGLMAVARDRAERARHALTADSRVLLVITEGVPAAASRDRLRPDRLRRLRSTLNHISSC